MRPVAPATETKADGVMALKRVGFPRQTTDPAVSQGSPWNHLKNHTFVLVALSLHITFPGDLAALGPSRFHDCPVHVLFDRSRCDQRVSYLALGRVNRGGRFSQQILVQVILLGRSSKADIHRVLHESASRRPFSPSYADHAKAF
jgi:hypothetical protein